ncbi:2-dehydro-3-deoxygluconokinase [Leuconostoc litchii]|uniref:Sugar kinase n=1 Tax=Leuconostoc litchii TaxID=1981069 RepID=A0A6P2CT51_9LACO|nr:sugar kinase [Leuconostoc litchii]TYC47419.1 sugar kinase [Leuconostoc litchii]GMA69435.1 2-dehydro-3-deoxygluconokinase [Leuconostoc litchii]
MSEILTLGEPVVTFASTDLNQGLVDSINYFKFLGGAELNVLIGATRLGHSTEYISQVGADPLGKFAIKEIARYNVGNHYISTDENNWTAFQLKELVNQGDPSTFNFRRNSAAAHFDKSLIDHVDFTDVKIAHLSGIFPAISLQSRAAFRYFAKKLIDRGIRTTFDPNLRPALWESREVMIETINDLAKYGEIVLPGIDEGEILMGSRDPEKIADFYLKNSERTQTVVVKVGSAGAYVKNKSGESYLVKGFKVEHVVDTVGAGDGFALGLITGLIEGLTMPEAVQRANAVGALQVQTPGDNDGYPTQSELKEFLETNKKEA